MGTIYYIGAFDFHKQNAESQLVLSNGNILRELGYQVVFIGNSEAGSQASEVVEFSVDRFKAYSVRFDKSLKGLINWRRADRNIKSILDTGHLVKAIIMYGTPTFAIQTVALQRWCKKNRIAFIVNTVDIPSLAHGHLLERIIKRLDRLLRKITTKYRADGIIAVSTFIARHFSKGKKKPICIIPPLKDTHKYPAPAPTAHAGKVIVYTGFPFPTDGRKVEESAYKDRLDYVIRLLYDVRTQHSYTDFTLHIYGCSKEQYLNVISEHRDLLEGYGDFVVFHGRVEREVAENALCGADFSIFLRKNSKMSNAGFPTKFVTSITCGTPVITTKTSDLEQYMVEGKYGFFLDLEQWDRSVAKAAACLRMDSLKIQEMKAACHSSGIFDYRRYIDVMRGFLASLGVERS